ncbi:hypothetical protein [Pirellula sp. SH-Sr6A]|uniref:hypothetical protein n=1 Tax=Pirellula sp. SH-Sr6A TaxID=1632865 RepID=UPI0011BA7648|nr:hypothetical protein [Pirellula sp. SH-Sr6A]
MKTHTLTLWMASPLLITFVLSTGCGSGSDAKADMTAEIESEIKAHDAAVEEAEKAQSAPAKKK